MTAPTIRLDDAGCFDAWAEAFDRHRAFLLSRPQAARDPLEALTRGEAIEMLRRVLSTRPVHETQKAHHPGEGSGLAL